MQPNSDLTDLLVALNAAGAEYVIVGAYALAFHGRPRATKDVDIFVGSHSDNAARVWEALVAFGAPLANVQPEDFATPGVFFVIGRPPNQIDVITAIDGVTFEQAWAARVTSSYGGVPAHFLGRTELIVNKKAAGRPQDLADLSYLKSEQS